MAWTSTPSPGKVQKQSESFPYVRFDEIGEAPPYNTWASTGVLGGSEFQGVCVVRDTLIRVSLTTHTPYNSDLVR